MWNDITNKPYLSFQSIPVYLPFYHWFHQEIVVRSHPNHCPHSEAVLRREDNILVLVPQPLPWYQIIIHMYTLWRFVTISWILRTSSRVGILYLKLYIHINFRISIRDEYSLDLTTISFRVSNCRNCSFTLCNGCWRNRLKENKSSSNKSNH